MESEEYGTERDGKGKFLPGNKQAAGRGINRVSAKVKESIVSFLEKNTDSIQESFDTLKPVEKLKFIADILPYATPKLSSIQSENETHLTGGINISWKDPELPNTEDKGSS
jgi:hypothetical protein